MEVQVSNGGSPTNIVKIQVKLTEVQYTQIQVLSYHSDICEYNSILIRFLTISTEIIINTFSQIINYCNIVSTLSRSNTMVKEISEQYRKILALLTD